MRCHTRASSLAYLPPWKQEQELNKSTGVSACLLQEARSGERPLPFTLGAVAAAALKGWRANSSNQRSFCSSWHALLRAPQTLLQSKIPRNQRSSHRSPWKQPYRNPCWGALPTRSSSSRSPPQSASPSLPSRRRFPRRWTPTRSTWASTSRSTPTASRRSTRSFTNTFSSSARRCKSYLARTLSCLLSSPSLRPRTTTSPRPLRRRKKRPTSLTIP
ncbi:unnamed protein product [Scytosiphon promiscuus]